MGKLWMIGLVIFALVQDCLKKDDDNPLVVGDSSQLIGTWYATSFTFVNTANTSQRVDMVQSGYLFSITFNENSTFSRTETFMGTVVDAGTGSYVTSGNQMTVYESSDTTVITWLLAGGVLTLTVENEEFDFDDDGVDENAQIIIVMTKTAPQGGGGSVPSEAVGTWVATSYTYVNQANSSQSYELISSGGGFTLMIQANGIFGVQYVEPGGATDSDGGTLTFSGNTVTAVTPTDVTTLTWSISGTTMTLMMSDTFDFDNNGTEQDASVTIVLTRQ